MNDPNETDPPPLPPSHRDPTPEEADRIFQETVIGLNVRGSDNVLQLVMVVVGTLLGAAIAHFVSGVPMVGALIGLVASVLVSGIVLMVRGRMRAAKFRKRK